MMYFISSFAEGLKNFADVKYLIRHFMSAEYISAWCLSNIFMKMLWIEISVRWNAVETADEWEIDVDIFFVTSIKMFSQHFKKKWEIK